MGRPLLCFTLVAASFISTAITSSGLHQAKASKADTFSPIATDMEPVLTPSMCIDTRDANSDIIRSTLTQIGGADGAFPQHLLLQSGNLLTYLLDLLLEDGACPNF
jgi:hypothetical protein